MKTKLSFLALPSCLGMVLALALAACGGDSGNNHHDGGTSSSTDVNLSSPVVSEEVTFNNFSVGVESGMVRITGNISAAKADPIVKVEFSIEGGSSSWFSYKGSPVTGPITYPVSDSVAFFRLTDVDIDLSNTSIPCGVSKPIAVRACSASGKCSSEPGSFTKPNDMCPELLSSATQVSSSSEAVWKFGPPSPAIDVSSGVSIAIGTGYFKLSGDDGQPDIEVENGKIRMVTTIGADEIVPGTAYSSKENFLGSLPPTKSKLDGDDGLQNKEYYLIYLNDGSKYLLYFTAKGSAPWPSWPKSCTYWLATESP